MGSATGSHVLRRWEIGTGLLMVAVLVHVHWSVLHHAGALWRDEVSSVNLASSPSFAQMLKDLYWDSFPALWCSVLRGWMALGLGASDFALRVLGALVGLCIIVALWWNSRRFACGTPLVSMLVFGFSPATFRYADGVRGYGLGVLLLLVMLGAIWSMIQDPSSRRVIVAGTASLLAVHSSFTNSYILLAIIVGGAAVCARARAWKTVGWLIGIGFVALVSMLPYLHVFAIHNEYSVILQTEIDLPWIASHFADALRTSEEHMVWVWLALAAISIAACAGTLLRAGAVARGKDQELALFTGIVLVAGAVCFGVYLKLLSVPTQQWYYLPIMALAAVLFDVAVDLLVRTSTAARIARLAAVMILGLSLTRNVSQMLTLHCTNVDVLAAELETLSAKEDVILVHPWYAGVTFARYYKGAAPWMTLPDFSAIRCQPYREFKQRMIVEQPIRQELTRIGGVLQKGHRVWLVGGLPFLPADEEPQPFPPAPQGYAGWDEQSYTENWAMQAAYLVQKHALELELVELPLDGPVIGHEDLPLFVAQGWR